MYYTKITEGDTIIEFHNNWLGEETVVVNGQIVSKKSSILGTSHPFKVFEDGQTARYILTTKVNEHMQILMDLSRNGDFVQENIPIRMGRKPKDPSEAIKKKGLVKLADYDLKEALVDFEEVLEYNPRDPETHFHMACAYSVLENVEEGFACLHQSVACGLVNTEAILNHDMLAYLRMHPAFEAFFESEFTSYDLSSGGDSQ